jgi:hypothetical protein
MRDLTYLHCPFLDPANYALALAFLTPPPAPRPRVVLVAAPRPPRLTTADLVAQSEWEQRGFTDAERDVWLAHGLGRYQAHIAEQCRRLGVQPPALHEVVHGRRIAERLRGGESVEGVIALLREETS